MLSIDANMPVAVFDPAEGDVDQAATLQFLRTLNLLALGTRSDNPDPQTSDTGHELIRLEAKVDLLVAMVGSLVAEHAGLPPVCPVVLSAESVIVDIELGHRTGNAVVVDLYPSSELPRALRLPAVVAATATAGPVEFVFGPLDPAVRDEIERYIFLRHRHALSRQSAK